MKTNNLIPIKSESDDKIYVPTFQYLSYWNGNTDTINFLLFAMQIEVKEEFIYINSTGESLKFLELCQPSQNSPAKNWEFEQMIQFLIETETSFLITGWLGYWSYPACTFNNGLKVYSANNGYGWEEKFTHFGYSWKLPYTAKKYEEGEENKYWYVIPYYCDGPFHIRDSNNGFAEADPLPYSYDEKEKILRISANRLFSRLPQLTILFKDAIDYNRYLVKRYKKYNKITVCYYAFKDETNNYTSKNHFNYLLDSRDLKELAGKMWIIAEKIPYHYQRRKKILTVKIKQDSQFREGWANAVKLPFDISKGSLTVKRTVGKWEKPQPVQGKFINGFKEWDNRCLEKYHINYTALIKLKTYKNHLKNGGKPIEAVGVYNCYDSHYSRVPFYDARDFLD